MAAVELAAVIGAALVLVLLVAILVARFAFAGPCPRCGRPIPRGMLDCPHCGFCTRRSPSSD